MNAIEMPRKTNTRVVRCEKHGQYESKPIVNVLTGEPMVWTQCPTCQSERKALDERVKARREAEERQARFNQLLGSVGVPEAFRDKTFENYVCENQRQAEALRLCRSYAKNFDKALKKQVCLLLCGNTGTGKNHLALAIVHEIMQKGYTAHYVRMNTMILHARPNYRDGGEKNVEKIESYSKPDLLIVDEIGLHEQRDSDLLLINEILGTRETVGKPTIYLSNLKIMSDDPGESTVSSILGARMMDRLRAGGKQIIFNWPSYRSRLVSTGVFDD